VSRSDGTAVNGRGATLSETHVRPILNSLDLYPTRSQGTFGMRDIEYNNNNNNNNNNNRHDNVYGAVIMTRVIARVYP